MPAAIPNKELVATVSPRMERPLHARKQIMELCDLLRKQRQHRQQVQMQSNDDGARTDLRPLKPREIGTTIHFRLNGLVPIENNQGKKFMALSWRRRRGGAENSHFGFFGMMELDGPKGFLANRGVPGV